MVERLLRALVEGVVGSGGVISAGGGSSGGGSSSGGIVVINKVKVRKSVMPLLKYDSTTTMNVTVTPSVTMWLNSKVLITMLNSEVEPPFRKIPPAVRKLSKRASVLPSLSVFVLSAIKKASLRPSFNKVSITVLVSLDLMVTNSSLLSSICMAQNKRTTVK